MKCPYCGNLNNRVVDSRLNKEYTITRRRRLCETCQRRFTTYERIEVTMPMLIKKDGRREAWDRHKVVEGLKKACQKRNISIETLEETADRIEHSLMERSLKEIDSSVVGEKIMGELHDIDDVAYVRFASVYRSFTDITDFMKEVKAVLKKKDTE